MSTEHFLPHVIKGDDGWEARWLPVSDETMDVKFSGACTAMPEVCRCISYDKDKAPDVPKDVCTERLLTAFAFGCQSRGKVTSGRWTTCCSQS